MNPQQAENLRILIRHMETKCDRILEMGHVTNACGTPGCAIGEATLIPQFELALIGVNERDDRGIGCIRHRGVVRGYVDTAQTLFGNDDLFNVFRFKKLNLAPHEWAAEARKVLQGHLNLAPQEWAAEARKVLQGHGYSMDDDKTWAAAKVAEVTRANPMLSLV